MVLVMGTRGGLPTTEGTTGANRGRL